MTEDITAILERPTCSVAELGRILELSKNPAYDAVKRGDFPSIRIRGRIRVLTAPLRRTLGMDLLNPNGVALNDDQDRRCHRSLYELITHAAQLERRP